MRHIPNRSAVRASIREVYADIKTRIPQATGSEKISLSLQAEKIKTAMKSWKEQTHG